MKRLALVFAILACLAAPALADVTITSTISGKGGMAAMTGQSVMAIKGTKMRIDTTMGNQQFTSIIDAATGQIVYLDHKAKEARTFDSTKLTAELQKETGAGDVKVAFAPNGQTQEILGRKCDGYDLAITMPMAAGGEGGMTITMGGPVFIAKSSPGAADYAAFYKAAIKNNVFLGGNPERVKGQGSNIRGMTEMYRVIADANGVPYSVTMQTKFEGTGPMAGMMSRMGGMSTTTTVTAVSVDPVPNDKFAVPAGYATRTK